MEGSTVSEETGADSGAEAAAESSEESKGEQPSEGLENALRRLKDENKGLKAKIGSFEAAAEKQRQESMTEQERAVEEARKEGYTKAMQEQAESVTKAKVVAAAAAAGYSDPADAPGLLGKQITELGDDEQIAEAVGKLAEGKPYLLKQKQRPEFEQGQQGKSQPSEADWLRKTMRGGR